MSFLYQWGCAQVFGLWGGNRSGRPSMSQVVQPRSKHDRCLRRWCDAGLPPHLRPFLVTRRPLVCWTHRSSKWQLFLGQTFLIAPPTGPVPITQRIFAARRNQKCRVVPDLLLLDVVDRPKSRSRDALRSTADRRVSSIYQWRLQSPVALTGGVPMVPAVHSACR
jgi:hypothetical protein